MPGTAHEGQRHDEDYGGWQKTGGDRLRSRFCQRHPGVGKKDGQTIIVFSGDFDKVMAAFIIANGAAAMGKNVKKSGMEKMFGAMIPRGWMSWVSPE